MRTPLIVANWKMNHTVHESLQFVTRFQKLLQNRPAGTKKNTEILICPPFTALYSLSVFFAEENPCQIWLGAQNCHFEKSGAFTGEVSAEFLKELACEYVLIGHSERRHIFGETLEMIAKKAKLVLAEELCLIFCVGETIEQRKEDKTWEVIQNQLETALSKLSKSTWNQITLAYEPVWAIGTGKTASPSDAQTVHRQIRNWVEKQTDKAVADSVRILYGGSVTPDNASALMKEPDVDGLLIGSASLQADRLSEIIHRI